MGRLSAGQSALISRLKAVSEDDLGTVTYTRGAVSLTLTGDVWLGRTLFASNAENGARVEWGEVDFLVAVADLSDTPDLGARFTLSGGYCTGVFEVMTPDTGEPAVRYSDQTRTVWRLHCKKVT